MPKREDERNQGKHPPACTCVDCVDRFLSRDRLPCPTCPSSSGRIIQIGSGKNIRCPTCFGAGTVTKEFMRAWKAKREAEAQREQTRGSENRNRNRVRRPQTPHPSPSPSLAGPGSWNHPPNCTCYTCNEGRRRQAEAVAPGPDAEDPLMKKLVAAVSEHYQADRLVLSRGVRVARAARSVARAARSTVATAVRYALLLHVFTLAGLVTYTLVREGGTAVPPMVADAMEAYTAAWESGLDAVKSRI